MYCSLKSPPVFSNPAGTVVGMIFVDEASREGKAASLKATECYDHGQIGEKTLKS